MLVFFSLRGLLYSSGRLDLLYYAWGCRSGVVFLVYSVTIASLYVCIGLKSWFDTCVSFGIL